MAQAYMTETGSGGSGPERRGSRLRRLLDGWRGDRGIWRRGLILAAVALLLALVMLLHAQIPNTIGNLGSLTETFLPWLGIAVPVLLVLALVRKSVTALIAVLLPAIVWLNVFGGLLSDKTGSGGDLTVATHNVNA
ncbi:MAG: vancomycin resistance protein VanJ, partial [Streptomyces sp.]|nr:vancomycin resistance protein VanJ [Streptomyces sp.]